MPSGGARSLWESHRWRISSGWRHPAIARATSSHACVRSSRSMADDRLGERACLYGTLKPDSSLSLKDVIEYLLAKGVAKFKLPERLEIVEALPSTSSRKIQKGTLGRISLRSWRRSQEAPEQTLWPRSSIRHR